MQKKILLQLFFFLIIITISVIFFKAYFLNKDINKISTNTEIIKNKNISKDNKSNIMQNIKYISNKDNDKNNYVIESEFGEFNNENTEIIQMTNVTATINIENSTPLKISSDKALYNSISYNTNFYENVIIAYEDNVIFSKNLDLMFLKNLAVITNDIVYKNLDIKMLADKIEVDLITKNTKILMHDKSDKVKVMNIN